MYAMLNTRPLIPKYIYFTLESTFLAILLTAKKLKEPNILPKMATIIQGAY